LDNFTKSETPIKNMLTDGLKSFLYNINNKAN